MARFKALVRGAYGEGNFGDDVLMVACHGLLRRVYAASDIAFWFPPGSELAYVKRLLPEINMIRSEDEAAAVDLVVWGGGTQFYAFSGNVRPFYRKLLAALRHRAPYSGLLGWCRQRKGAVNCRADQRAADLTTARLLRDP